MKSLLTDSHSAFALLIVTAATALLIFGKLSPDQWVACAQWLFTALIGGHVVMNTAATLGAPSSRAPSGSDVAKPPEHAP